MLCLRRLPRVPAEHHSVAAKVAHGGAAAALAHAAQPKTAATEEGGDGGGAENEGAREVGRGWNPNRIVYE